MPPPAPPAPCRASRASPRRADAVKARLETSSDTVKPMPAHAPAATSTGSAIGERGPWSAGREAIQEPANIPIGLPTTYPTRIPSVIGEVTASLEELRGHVDAGVGEREQRHDHIARPRVELVLEPLVRRDRRQQALLRRARELGRRLLAERRASASWPARGPRVTAGRRLCQPDRQPGDHRVDPRLEHRDPDRHRHADRDRGAAERRIAQRDQHRRTARSRCRARGPRRASCRRSRSRRSAARSSTTASDSRNTRIRVAVRGVTSATAASANAVSRRHRRPPAVRARAAGVERQVDRDRHDDAADRRQHRDREPAAFAQLAEIELALGLEADDEEEQRHQPSLTQCAGRPRSRRSRSGSTASSSTPTRRCATTASSPTATPRSPRRASRTRRRTRCSGNSGRARRGSAPTRSGRRTGLPRCRRSPAHLTAMRQLPPWKAELCGGVWCLPARQLGTAGRPDRAATDARTTSATISGRDSITTCDAPSASVTVAPIRS